MSAGLDRVFEAFDRLRALPRHERPAALKACLDLSDDDRTTLRELLEHDASTDRFFGRSLRAATSDLLSPLIEAAVPRRIGEFEIERPLGSGSFGLVFLARQNRPPRPVALKVLHRRAQPADMARFRFEAAALARLQHPNITTVFACDEADGLAYLAMEYVEGVPLDEFCRAAPLSIPARLRLLVQVCEGLAHAHQRGILHRDLAPKNILVTAQGTPKILDFGLARDLDGARAAALALTLPGSAIGTLRYASPEQLHEGHDRVDVRSDVYSLGVIAFEALTGRHPFVPAKTPLAESIERLSHAPPASPHTLPGWRGGRDLSSVLLKAVERDPSRRYQSVEHLRDDLLAVLDGRPVRAVPPTAAYRLRRYCGRHKVLSSLLGLLGLVTIAGIVATGEMARQAAQAHDAAIHALEVVVVRALAPLEPRIGTLEERERLLADIGPSIRSVYNRRPRDERIQRLYGGLLSAEAETRTARGDTHRATALLREAAEVLQSRWHASGHADTPTAHRLAMVLARLGDEMFKQRRLTDSLRLHQQALELDEELALRWPRDLGVLSNLFWSQTRIAERRDVPMGQRACETARSFATAARMMDLAPRDGRALEAWLHVRHAQAWAEREPTARAAASLECWDIAERLVALDPSHTMRNTTLLVVLGTVLGQPHLDDLRSRRSAAWARAGEVADRLYRGAARTGVEVDSLANFYTNRSRLAATEGRTEEAVRDSHRAISLWRRLLRGRGGRPEIGAPLAHELLRLASLQGGHTHRLDSARDDVRRAAAEIWARFGPRPDTLSIIRQMHEAAEPQTDQPVIASTDPATTAPPGPRQ